MNKIKFLSICLLGICMFVSCERYPISALTGLPSDIAAWPDPWYLFYDELNTKGSFNPNTWGSADLMTLDFASRENPQSGTKCIKMSWVGNTTGGLTYAGWGLKSTEQGGGTDLSASGYKSVKFYIKGNLFENCWVKIKVLNVDATEAIIPVTSIWSEGSIDISSIIGASTSVPSYIAVTMGTGSMTNGGTIYIDNIRLCKD